MSTSQYDIHGEHVAAPSTGVAPERVSAAVDRLVAAHFSGVPCRPVRDLIGRDDIAAAYQVQQGLNATRIARGARVVGRKIGATSEAVQRQLGVDQPDFGVLFADMAYSEDAVIPLSRLIQPRAEAEMAFVLAEDLAEGPLDLAQIRGAVDYAVAALEIVDSRIRDWDVSFADTVADNASSGVYVLGAQRCSLADVEPAEVTMSMSVDGEEVSTGTGAACLGDPLAAVAWLSDRARTFGEPLRAGQIILSGALGPMRPIPPGAIVTAAISGLGSVTAKFSAREDQS